MPAPKPDITIISIRVALVQTVQVTNGKEGSLVRTREKQLARFYNARSVMPDEVPGFKVAYLPRWKAGESVSVSQLVMLPTHEVCPSISVLSRQALAEPRMIFLVDVCAKYSRS